jgi:hypothetical protein
MCLETLVYFEKTVDLIHAQVWMDFSVFPISQIAIIPLCVVWSRKHQIMFACLVPKLHVYKYPSY